MKTRTLLIARFAAVALAATYAKAAEITISDFSATPDGTTTNFFQHTTLGSTVLPAGTPKTVYVVSKFTFGTNSNAHVQWQFSISATAANRIGIEVQDTGLIQTLSTGNGALQAFACAPMRTTVNLATDMAGQTITLLAKLHYDATNDVAYGARTACLPSGSASTSDDTLMTVWINPDNTDVEGSGITAGDMYALWNSAAFTYFRQTIQNQSTPGTAGASFITDTMILTDANATFANALALALPPVPAPGSLIYGK